MYECFFLLFFRCEEHGIKKELIAAGVLCTVFQQCALDDKRCIPENAYKKLEETLLINKKDIIHFNILLLEIIWQNGELIEN